MSVGPRMGRSSGVPGRKTGPCFDDFGGGESGAEFDRGVEHLANSGSRHALFESGFLFGASGDDAAVAARHQITALGAQHAIQPEALMPQREHLPANRSRR